MKTAFLSCCLLALLNAAAQTGNVGIGTTSPQARLHVADSSVLFSAAGMVPTTTGNPPASGSGRRLMWYPGKAAFRAGYVSGNFWDKDSIGAYSFAAGANTRATDLNSVALNEGTRASSQAALASGYFSVATGFAATALGDYTIASGVDATSLGCETVASGFSAISMGYQTLASGHFSTAIGQNSCANTFVATAIGFNDTATGHTSMALGGGLYARSWGEVAVGTFNLDYTAAGINGINPVDRLFVIGNGTGNTTRSNALTVLKNGHIGIGTVNPTQKLEVTGNVNATAYLSPQTGTANMIAAAYGNVFSNATNLISNASGNCTLNHIPGSGQYTITFTGANLSGTNIGTLPVTATIFGNLPGMVTFAGGSNGVLVVYTFNSIGTPADRGFGFTVYKP